MRNIAISLPLLAASGLFIHTPDANAATSSCHLPDGWSQVEQRQPRYVIFGELHGTAQSPAFVEDIACALATSGKSVLVGVELHAVNDPQFQDAWGKPHDRFADVLRKVGWAGRQDGVASEAMFSMLVNLHALKAKGARIAIVAFSGTKNAEQKRKFANLPGQGPHDAAMAENIADASHAQAYDLTLVLVGNIHARLQSVSFAGATFHPMAMKLAETGTLVSLDMKSTGGTAWNCQLRDGFKPEAGKPVRNEDIACVSRPVSADPDPQPDQSIVLKRSADGTYDGAFWLGHIDGSPPAVPAG